MNGAPHALGAWARPEAPLGGRAVPPPPRAGGGSSPSHPHGTAAFDGLMGFSTSFIWLVYWSKLIFALDWRLNAQNVGIVLALAVVGVLPHSQLYSRLRNVYIFVLRAGLAWLPVW
jgi:hypothetical protein